MFVLMNFSLATFMDPGVIPRGNIFTMLWSRLLKDSNIPIKFNGYACLNLYHPFFSEIERR